MLSNVSTRPITILFTKVLLGELKVTLSRIVIFEKESKPSVRQKIDFRIEIDSAIEIDSGIEIVTKANSGIEIESKNQNQVQESEPVARIEIGSRN